jgi:hypothetical protein
MSISLVSVLSFDGSAVRCFSGSSDPLAIFLDLDELIALGSTCQDLALFRSEKYIGFLYSRIVTVVGFTQHNNYVYRRVKWPRSLPAPPFRRFKFFHNLANGQFFGLTCHEWNGSPITKKSDCLDRQIRDTFLTRPWNPIISRVIISRDNEQLRWESVEVEFDWSVDFRHVADSWQELSDESGVSARRGETVLRRWTYVSDVKHYSVKYKYCKNILLNSARMCCHKLTSDQKDRCDDCVKNPAPYHVSPFS